LTVHEVNHKHGEEDVLVTELTPDSDLESIFQRLRVLDRKKTIIPRNAVSFELDINVSSGFFEVPKCKHQTPEREFGVRVESVSEGVVVHCPVHELDESKHETRGKCNSVE
jgi:hypothetical protein